MVSLKLKDVQEPRSGQKPRNQRLPEIYYRRRRVAAVIILVVLVIICALLLSLCGRSEETSTTGDEAVETTSSSAATSSETSAAATTSEEATSSEAEESETATEETTAATVAEGDLCDPANLELVANSSASTYTNPDRPTFYLTLRNTSDADCLVNLDETPLAFTVYNLANDERIWGDTDCNAPVAQGLVELAAGQERYYQAIWSRTSSAPEQCSDRTAAAAGAYYLLVTLDGDRSAPHTFNLA